MAASNSSNQRDASGVGVRRAVLVQISDFGLGRGLFLTEALSAAGLNVMVVTNQPVYQQTHATSIDEAQPIRLFSFNIPFARVLYRSIFGRLIVYSLFSAIAFLKMIRIKAQILYSRGPQPFTEISCLAYKFFVPSSTIISDTTDLWPDSLEYVNMSHALKSLLMRIGLGLNKLVYKHVDAVVTHNAELARILHERFRKPIHIIYGVIDLDRFKTMEKKQAAAAIQTTETNKLVDKFVILYAGLLGPFQDPLKIVDIAKRLDHDAVFLVVGTGPLKGQLQSRATVLGVENITFLGTQPFDKMPYLYNLADVNLLTYAKLPFLKIGLPKKFIEYAACGKPILCMSPPCVASDLAVSWKAGYCADPDNIDDVVRMIKQLKDDPQTREMMGKNARLLAENLFSINAAAETLKDVVRS